MAETSHNSRTTKYRASWKSLLSSRLRRSSTHQREMSQSPVSNNSRVLIPDMDSSRPLHTLVRSNARAKSPRNLQTMKPAGNNSQSLSCKGTDNSRNQGNKISPFTDGNVTMNLEAKIPLPSPPPYVLSLPDAVVTPPSLVALTSEELRSRGIYSPHPKIDHGIPHDASEIYRSAISRDTSLRSALSLFVPRFGMRPGGASGDMQLRPDDHRPSLFSSTFLAIGVCASMLMTALDRGAITTAIPSIMTDFQSFEQMGWYGSAYLLTASVFQPIYGRVYTSFNVKWSFLIAVAIFQAGAIICAVASSSEVFIFGRAVQGIGSSGISTGSFAITAHDFSAGGMFVVTAWLDILYWIGSVTGPVIGAVFSQLLSWQWCCYLNLMLAGTTFTCVLLFSKSHRSRTSRPNIIRQASDFSFTGKSFARRIMALDWIGGALLMAACTFLFLTLQLSQEKEFDWSSLPWIIFTSLSVTIMMVCILWMQLRGDNALIPFHVVRQRTVAASCGAAFFLSGAFTIYVYYLPFWFRVIRNQNAIESGVSMIPYMLTVSVLSLAFGRLVFRKGCFALSTIIGCAIAIVGAGLMILLDVGTSVVMSAGLPVVIAAGLGLAMQRSLSAVQAVLHPHEVSIGTDAVNAYQNAGGAIFISAGNALFQKYLFQSNEASDVDIRAMMKLGVTEFSTLIPAEAHFEVLKMYSHALRAVFIAVIPLCGIALLLSMFMERNITQDDQDARSPRSTSVQSIHRGLSSPELGSDAPTLAHLAPRARQRWSRGWSGRMMDAEAQSTKMAAVMQERNESHGSLSSLEVTTDAEIKEMDIGIAR